MSNPENTRQATGTQARSNVMAQTIDLFDMAKYFLKYWPILILATVMGMVIPGVFVCMKPYTYTSSSMIYVLSSTTSITSLSDIQIGTQLSDDFEVIILSKPVLDKAIDKVELETGVTLTRKYVKKATTVTHANDTRILQITCTTEDATLSKTLCAAITEASMENMTDITQTDAPTIVEPAELAEKPDSKGILKIVAWGGMIALLVVVSVLAAIYVMNDKISREEDISTYLGEVTIGVIPYEKTIAEGKNGRRK